MVVPALVQIGIDSRKFTVLGEFTGPRNIRDSARVAPCHHSGHLRPLAGRRKPYWARNLTLGQPKWLPNAELLNSRSRYCRLLSTEDPIQLIL